MGGIIAMHIAYDHPHLFDKLILNDIGTFLSKESLSKIARYVRIYPSFTDLEHAKAHLKTKLVNFGIRAEENWDYITKHSTHMNDKGELVLDYDIGVTDSLLGFKGDKAYDVDFYNLWEHLKAKQLLLLRGNNSDVFLHQNALELLNSRNNTKLIEFENTGHAPALMEEEQLDPVIQYLITEQDKASH